LLLRAGRLTLDRLRSIFGLLRIFGHGRTIDVGRENPLD
jgi:hypothetical protein